MNKDGITLLTLQTATSILTKTNTEVKGSQTSDFSQVLTSLHSYQPRMKFLGPLYSNNWASDDSQFMHIQAWKNIPSNAQPKLERG